jgi:hypothetical protein
MSDEYPDISKIHRAPNEKFYALWQGRVLCRPTGALRYFETEHEARAFLTEYAADDPIDRSLHNSGGNLTLARADEQA